MIENMTSGILLDNISPKSILEALEYAIVNTTFRISSGELVKQIVKTEFTWLKSATRLVEISKEMSRQ